MKKKLICLLTIFSLFLTFFAFAPITLKAAEETPEMTTNRAVDTSSNQLVDGTGYFKKIENSTQYMFYYTNYLGDEVDYKIDENLYVKKINRSATPDEWYNSSYGLDLDNFESVSIIKGKWALPYEYAKDEKGVIIPESTGYLEESIYSDCRRYVYYLVYVNEDGVQRPKFDKHYECNVEIDDIPSYLLNDGKNEKMGIQEGKIYNTTLLTYQAIRVVDSYCETKIFSTESYAEDKIRLNFDWYPVIYFNINDIDFDYLLSVKFSYTYAQFTKGIFGIGVDYEKRDTRISITDEVFFDENLKYINESSSAFFITQDDSISLLNYVNIKNVFYNLEINYYDEYKLLEKGNWEFEVYDENYNKNIDKIFVNRIIGHPFNNNEKNNYKIVSEKTSFIKIVYTYNGVLYASDDNIIINVNDYTPDLPTTQDILDDFLKDLMDSLGKMPATLVDAASDSLITVLISFWTNLSPTSKTLIISILVVVILSFTSPFWLPHFREWWYKNKPRAYDESLKISNRKVYNKQHKKERKELKEDRRYDKGIFKRNRKIEIDNRKYYSDRVDKKYQHEEYIQNLRNASFDEQRKHDEYMLQQQNEEKVKERRFWNKQQKAKDLAIDKKYKENSLWRRFYNKRDKEKYAHEELLQANQLKENEANRKYWRNKNKQSSKTKSVKQSNNNKMDPDVIEALKNIKVKKPWE